MEGGDQGKMERKDVTQINTGGKGGREVKKEKRFSGGGLTEKRYLAQRKEAQSRLFSLRKA